MTVCHRNTQLPVSRQSLTAPNSDFRKKPHKDSKFLVMRLPPSVWPLSSPAPWTSLLREINGAVSSSFSSSYLLFFPRYFAVSVWAALSFPWQYNSHCTKRYVISRSLNADWNYILSHSWPWHCGQPHASSCRFRQLWIPETVWTLWRRVKSLLLSEIEPYFPVIRSIARSLYCLDWSGFLTLCLDNCR
jgi:hypothetical protein